MVIYDEVIADTIHRCHTHKYDSPDTYLIEGKELYYSCYITSKFLDEDVLYMSIPK